MADDAGNLLRAARDEAYSMPIEQIDMSLGQRFQDNTIWPFFERLRHEDPVHHTAESEFGPYWSITRYDDIMAVETNHAVFSSEGSITLNDPQEDFTLPMFIAMDPPKHDAQRKVISPIVSPHNLAGMEPLIRERAGQILDELLIGETFDWVDRVSVELTTQMLATLFDFPFEERRKLTYWSNIAAGDVDDDMTEEVAKAELFACGAYFQNLWDVRVKGAPANDLISMLAHGEATRNMPPMEFLGNILLLIVGGNDTTRNSISGGLLALNQFPDQYAKLRANPELIVSMVPEIVRWQTPVAHMRRTALADIEFGGKTIRKGDKVAMWYVSGNRDETVIDDPDRLIIDRERPRQHLSFGFGIHRCVGNRMAEMQLRVVWEEILKRFPVIEVVEEPVRAKNCFLRAYRSMPVRIPARA
ncbi:MAG TPA: cytochrome P450 [Caulobacteraceae bacterium]|jgi:cytochrome P450|nr:cytochrome P450 [Caulobacteraceae bacterium]